MDSHTASWGWLGRPAFFHHQGIDREAFSREQAPLYGGLGAVIGFDEMCDAENDDNDSVAQVLAGIFLVLLGCLLGFIFTVLLLMAGVWGPLAAAPTVLLSICGLLAAFTFFP